MGCAAPRRFWNSEDDSVGPEIGECPLRSVDSSLRGPKRPRLASPPPAGAASSPDPLLCKPSGGHDALHDVVDVRELADRGAIACRRARLTKL